MNATAHEKERRQRTTLAELNALLARVDATLERAAGLTGLLDLPVPAPARTEDAAVIGRLADALRRADR